MNNTFTKRETNILKGIALLFLIFHHCFLTPARYKHISVSFFPIKESYANLLAYYLRICVPMFVFFTAFGITLSIKKKYKTLDLNFHDIKEYIKHRYFNLFTGWIFIFFLVEIITCLIDGLPRKRYGYTIKGLLHFTIDGLGFANLFKTPTLVATWWYMTVAFMLIILLPFIIKLYSKSPYVLCAVIILISKLYTPTKVEIFRWLPIAYIGILFADKEVLQRIKSINPPTIKILKFIIGIILILLSIKFKKKLISRHIYVIVDGIMPAILIWFCYEFIVPIKYLNRFLEFIGKHSMNIFLTHTLIRANYFRKTLYGLKYAPLIVLVLLAISIAISIAIEFLKEISRYNKFVDSIREKYINKNTN